LTFGPRAATLRLLAGIRRIPAAPSVRVSTVELKVEAVALDWRGSPIVVLREREGQRAVFIWVGISEAAAISMHLEGQLPPRPLTHDLIAVLLDKTHAQVERVVIADMRDNTYYAHLYLRGGDGTHTIDCRPSDAIAVALRMEAPIQIDSELLARLDQERKESEAELSPGATRVDPDQTIVH
jgi:bifunctional DNase/RNase